MLGFSNSGNQENVCFKQSFVTHGFCSEDVVYLIIQDVGRLTGVPDFLQRRERSIRLSCLEYQFSVQGNPVSFSIAAPHQYTPSIQARNELLLRVFHDTSVYHQFLASGKFYTLRTAPVVIFHDLESAQSCNPLRALQAIWEKND